MAGYVAYNALPYLLRGLDVASAGCQHLSDPAIEIILFKPWRCSHVATSLSKPSRPPLGTRTVVREEPAEGDFMSNGAGAVEIGLPLPLAKKWYPVNCLGGRPSRHFLCRWRDLLVQGAHRPTSPFNESSLSIPVSVPSPSYRRNPPHASGMWGISKLDRCPIFFLVKCPVLSPDGCHPRCLPSALGQVTNLSRSAMAIASARLETLSLDRTLLT